MVWSAALYIPVLAHFSNVLGIYFSTNAKEVDFLVQLKSLLDYALFLFIYQPQVHEILG